MASCEGKDLSHWLSGDKGVFVVHPVAAGQPWLPSHGAHTKEGLHACHPQVLVLPQPTQDPLQLLEHKVQLARREKNRAEFVHMGKMPFHQGTKSFMAMLG